MSEAKLGTDAASPPTGPCVSEPDAHGQAALLLSESILHALVAARTFSNEQAIEVVRIAVEVKTEVATAAGESKARIGQSLALLAGIERSFQSDSRKL